MISVLTPTVPERGAMLVEAWRSVQEQTITSFEHLIHMDDLYEGCAVTMNRLAERAHGEWLLPLADDDLLLPDCLGAHLDGAATGADIIYSPPIVEGEAPDGFHGTPPRIPSLALIRTSLWRQLGGYEVTLGQCEDYDFYMRATGQGARFHRIEGGTWIYRFHGANKSRGHTFQHMPTPQ